jgi:hypothetical protein
LERFYLSRIAPSIVGGGFTSQKAPSIFERIGASGRVPPIEGKILKIVLPINGR